MLLVAQLRNGSQKRRNVDHGHGLKRDADQEGPLPADEINKEEGTANRSDELDDAEYPADQQRLVLAADTQEIEEVGGVERDRAGTRPLRKELYHDTEVQAVRIARHKD